MAVVAFGGERFERVEIDVRGYERPPTGEYYDDNWLTVQVTVAAGGFEGSFDAVFQAAEFVGFREQLSNLHAALSGSARFQTMEEQLALQLSGNGRGSIELRGEASDQSGIGNKLSFTLSLDQTHIAQALAQLERVTLEYPVRDV